LQTEALPLEFTSTTCIFAEELGGTPECLDSEQEGTPVIVLPFPGPEGYFIQKGAIGSWQQMEVPELYSVNQVSKSAYSDEDCPAREYAIDYRQRGGKNEGYFTTLSPSLQLW